MTNLEAFNKVELHLLAQNKQSRHKFANRCAYRGTEGTMCAVGCLIPDSEYKVRMEDVSLVRIQKGFNCLTGLDIDMLRDLQRLHDTQQPYEWLEGLRVLRDRYFTGRQALV